jgi:tetratricopeptide (TPR) repeat protein
MIAIFIPFLKSLRDPLLDDLSDLATGGRAFNQRGDYASLDGRFRAALEAYRQAVEASPDNAEYRVDLASTLIRLDDLDAAVAHLREALRLAPAYGMAHYNLAIVLARRGRYKDAVPHHRQALTADPNHRDARFNLASVLMRLERFEEAAVDFGWVVDTDPLNVGAHFGRGVALMRLERWQEAGVALEESHRARPGDVMIASLLARLLAACPLAELRDGRRALALARRLACEDRSLTNVETLAMALAEVGRFDQAVQLQEESLGAVRDAGQRHLEANLEANLARYRQRLATRSPLGN